MSERQTIIDQAASGFSLPEERTLDSAVDLTLRAAGQAPMTIAERVQCRAARHTWLTNLFLEGKRLRVMVNATFSWARARRLSHRAFVEQALAVKVLPGLSEDECREFRIED